MVHYCNHISSLEGVLKDIFTVADNIYDEARRDLSILPGIEIILLSNWLT